MAADKRLFSEVQAGELNPAAAKSRLNKVRRAGANSTSSFTIVLIQVHTLGTGKAQALPLFKGAHLFSATPGLKVSSFFYQMSLKTSSIQS